MRHTILVIGCGSIGRRHARLLSERKDVRLLLADSNAHSLKEAASESRCVKAYARYTDALSDRVHGAIICTPDALHVDMAEKVLLSGACALIEKPAAVNAAQASRLMTLEREQSILVGYMGRFHPQLGQVKAMLEGGELGTILYGNASVYTYGTLLCAKSAYRDTERWSLVIDYTHEIDFLNYLLGRVSLVAALCSSLGGLEHRPDPNMLQIMLRYASGALGSIHMDYVRYPDKRTLEIVGDRGSVELYMNEGLLRISRPGQEGFQEIRYPYHRDDLFRKEHQHFIDLIEGKAAPAVGLRDGIEALKVADAVIESCEKGCFVSLS